MIEGRDIGAVVCPDAEVKVYLTAEESERARRRRSERPGDGDEETATDLRLRDLRDTDQLRPAPDAVEIDTTRRSVDEVVRLVERLVEARART